MDDNEKQWEATKNNVKEILDYSTVSKMNWTSPNFMIMIRRMQIGERLINEKNIQFERIK